MSSRAEKMLKLCGGKTVPRRVTTQPERELPPPRSRPSPGSSPVRSIRSYVDGLDAFLMDVDRYKTQNSNQTPEGGDPDFDPVSDETSCDSPPPKKRTRVLQHTTPQDGEIAVNPDRHYVRKLAFGGQTENHADKTQAACRTTKTSPEKLADTFQRSSENDKDNVTHDVMLPVISPVDILDMEVVIHSPDAGEVFLAEGTEVNYIDGIEPLPDIDEDLDLQQEEHGDQQPGHNTRRSRKDSPKERTRKRSLNPANWQANIAKEACNKGKQYTNSRGKEVSSRKMGAPCENCRFKCSEKLTEPERASIFAKFWNFGNHTRQWVFICMHMEETDRKKKTTNWHSNRRISRRYFFKIDRLDVKDVKVYVCQSMFLSTLGISQMWIRTASAKQSSNVSPDKRGKHSNKHYKIKGPIKDSIVEHINMFERVPSHYCRQNSQKDYLEEGLSVRKMYAFYADFMREKQTKMDELADLESKPKTVLTWATERQYRDVFNYNFNISFFSPRKDQCDLCVAWKLASPEQKEELKDRYEKHIKTKDIARKLKDADKSEALKDPTLCVASFDLQKVLNCPHGEAGSFYYVSKLAVYNFTVYDIGKRQGYCYSWSEETAKRGSNEIGSCMKNFVERLILEGVTEFRLYSDNCTGQNKNRYIYALWNLLAEKHKVKITHTFLEVGHTQTEGDSMHSTIEAKSRKMTIYTPQEWFTLIKAAKSNNPYVVKEVTQEDVYDLKSLLNGKNWEKDTAGNKIPWMEVRSVQVHSNSPGILKFKCDLSIEEYSTMSLRLRGGQVKASLYEFKKAYSGKLPVTKKKKEGLLSLCNKNLIPADRKHVFFDLTTD